MLQGRIASSSLLTKYSLEQYSEIIKHYKSGNIDGLRYQIGKNQAQFIRQGTYLILEKLQLLAFRNLFKRT